jgi:integrase
MAESCPQCGSSRLYRDGLRNLNDGSTVQRWLCRSCGYRFSEPNIKLNIRCKVSKALDPIDNSHKGRVVSGSRTVQESANGFSFLLSENIRSHNLSSVAKGLNGLPLYSSNAEYASKRAKNLSATELKAVAEKVETEASRGKIVEFAWHLKREGCTDATIKTYTSLLRKLELLKANILSPETVKDALAKADLKPNTKATIIAVYTSFLKYLGLTWKAPKCQYERPVPFIPLEGEIDDLIAGCSRALSALLLTLKESGMRVGEALRLKWIDLNPQSNTITLNDPEKHSRTRIFPVSSKLVGMLQSLPKKSELIFGCHVASKQTSFKKQRKRLAEKLANPRLNQITFHTFRHWKGTMEYHKTHDIEHVQRLLGHRDIENTMIYINMEQLLFKTENDEFHVKTAESLDEACKLLEVGFEYVTDMDGKKLFRKRK